MATVVIACGTIKDEIKKALQLAGKDYPLITLKPGLDDKPQELREALQAELDKLAEPSLVLLGYGFSNGALVDFPAGPHTLVAPQAEDVICLIMGSQKRRDEFLAPDPAYFITEGWMRGDALLINYDKAVAKYGPEKAAKLQKAMMSHYKRFLLVDTGVYDTALWKEKLAAMAAVLGIPVEEEKGDLSWLIRLVEGPPWADDFVRAEPGQMLTLDPRAGSIG